LSTKLKEKELEITKLSLTQQSEEDAEKLQSLEAARLQLLAKHKSVLELEGALKETRQLWAQALGNEKAAMECIDEQLQKFEKRWSEFTTAGGQTDALLAQSKQIVELEHKLHQAMENVRQAESARVGLTEALDMNTQLTNKVEEFKAKYTALQAGRASVSSSREGENAATAATTQNTNSNNNSTSGGGNLTPRSGASGGDHATTTPTASVSSEQQQQQQQIKYEKMHRDYRRARKELAAMTASRETAKQKLERIEKERDNLMSTNSRLLRQSTEKDDMNAKSLSTILHLKSLTEQLTLEKDNLEQQTKNASQLALAARLASNAKGRLSEEVLKEKEALGERFEALEKAHAETKSQLEKITHDWSEGSGEMTALKRTLENSLKRSNDLVVENESKAEEIRRLVDSLDKAASETMDAKEKLNKVLKSSGGGTSNSTGSSSFSVDQLNTQISVLKGRLACPVCHYRDKECIIMRCRHMHCKQCVDERISNRSRKCPTCNNKFSEKDVEDVWLS
jgi:E3 ubiquitin-protein ligase BRE1